MKGGLNSFEFVKLVLFFVSRVMHTGFSSSHQFNIICRLPLHEWVRVRACKEAYVCALCWLIKIITCQTSIGLLWWRNICCDKNAKVLCGFPFSVVLNSIQRICRQVAMIHIPQAVKFAELTFKKIRKLSARHYEWLAEWKIHANITILFCHLIEP